MFGDHPDSQKLVPALAGVPLSQLAENEDFQVLVHTCSAVATFIVTNLDNEKILNHILVQQTKPEHFVSYIHPIHQLDEVAHVILSAIKEEVSVDEATSKALLVASSTDTSSATLPLKSSSSCSLLIP